MSKEPVFPWRGEIWLVEFPPAKETRKPIRPVLVISDDLQNEFDKWIVVVPITTEESELIARFEIFIENAPETGLKYPSKIQLNYPFTVDKERFKEHLGVASKEIMEQAKMTLINAFIEDEWY